MEQTILNHRKEKLRYYSPYNFVKTDADWGAMYLTELIENPHNQIFTFESSNKKILIYYQLLTWDTNYFGVPCFKVFNIFFEDNWELLLQGLQSFKDKIIKENTKYYIFAEIPTEDTTVLQAFTLTGFRLVENRVHYYKNDLQNFDNQRFVIRNAVTLDTILLRKVAQEARNEYDRLHADACFDNLKADEYLATYAEACLKGFAHKILIPNEANQNEEAFLVIKNTEITLETTKKLTFARILLTAVLPSCKGWHYKLVSETIYYAKENNFDYVLMTTQAANKAVIHNAEKLGFKLANLSHIFVASKF